SESQGPRRVILVAVDHSEPSRRALSFAADLIKADPTVEPHAVHAITPAYRTSHEEVRTRAVTQERDTRDDRAETDLPAFYAEMLRALGPNVVGHLRFGRADRE